MRVSPGDQGEKGRPQNATRKSPGRRVTAWISVLRYLRAAVFLVNARTLAMASLACAMVYLCESGTLDYQFRIDFSILSTGTVFPLVFAIQQAFSRREQALANMAVMKSQLMAMYFCHRDWDVSDGPTVRSALGNDASARAAATAGLIGTFLTLLRRWLVRRTAFESESEWRLLYGSEARYGATPLGWLVDLLPGTSLGGRQARDARDDRTAAHGKASAVQDDNGDDDEYDDAVSLRGGQIESDPHFHVYYELYDVISQMSVQNESLMIQANYTKGGEGGMSRLNVLLSKVVETTERLRYLRDYRTPFMLRYVSLTLIVASVVLAAPYFAFMCDGSRWEDDRTGTCPAGYYTAVLFVLVTMTLYHVQVALENPFDGLGLDDVFVTMDAEFATTMRRYRSAAGVSGNTDGGADGNSNSKTDNSKSGNGSSTGGKAQQQQQQQQKAGGGGGWVDGGKGGGGTGDAGRGVKEAASLGGAVGGVAGAGAGRAGGVAKSAVSTTNVEAWSNK